ncbi:DUF7693 family protein [Pseudomonas viridiflava]
MQLDDDSAMYAEQRLKGVRAAAPSLQVDSDSGSTSGELSAREVCQVLRDAIFGRRAMVRICAQTWDELHAGMFMVDIDGWSVMIFNDCDELD